MFVFLFCPYVLNWDLDEAQIPLSPPGGGINHTSRPPRIMRLAFWPFIEWFTGERARCHFVTDVVKATVTQRTETSGSGRRSLTESHFVPTGKPLSADQDPGRLLLLCVRAARGQGRPRLLLRGDGAGHDRGHLVRHTRTHAHSCRLMRDFSDNGCVWWKLEAASAASLNGASDSHAIFPPYAIKTLKLYSFGTSQCPSTHPSSVIHP